MPGVEVLDAENPEAALVENSDRHPDVVVIDPSSAGSDVEKLVGDLRRTLDSAIVVFTGNGGPRLLADALQARGTGYVRQGPPPQDPVRASQAAQVGGVHSDP